MVCPLAVNTESVEVKPQQLGADDSATAEHVSSQMPAPVLLGRKPERRRLQNAKVGPSKKSDGSRPCVVADQTVRSSRTEGSQLSVTDDANSHPAPDNVDNVAVHDPDAERTPASSSFQQTMIVFDWDDTLLPSSWLKQQRLLTSDCLKNSFALSRSQQDQLVEIADAAVELVRLAKTLGNVMIITSAEQGWVQATCHKFLPSLEPLLETFPIVCARACLKDHPKASPAEWKLLTFDNELQRAYKAETCKDSLMDKHVISIGDGPHEREALFAVAPALQNCHAKSVKLFERPDICELSMQQTLIAGFLSGIVQHAGNLDLSMQDSCAAIGGA